MSDSEMHHAEETVRAFLAKFAGGIEGIKEGLGAYAADDIHWASSGFPTVVGVPAAKQMLDDAWVQLEFGPMHIDILDTACEKVDRDEDGTGGRSYRVWAERVDNISVTVLAPAQDPEGHWPDPDGDGYATISPGVGSVYTVRDGKIATIAEYWDPTELLAYGAARAT